SVMESRGASKGEALHTQTFLGNPLGCAMALAALDEMARLDLPKLARALEAKLRARLPHIEIQGMGGMLGLRLPDTLRLSRGLLEKGFLVLPAGAHAEVLALTPPLTITDAQLEAFVVALESLL
ncbi:MAG: acetylornithine/succinyldiaminopimelate/putrescine aminotransferase, partial [Cognaticolwellia sp.]